MAEKEEKKEVEKFSAGEIATATEQRIIEGENVYTSVQALAMILNKLDNLEKKIVG